MSVKSILTAAILSCFGMTAHAEQVMDTDVVVGGRGIRVCGSLCINRTGAEGLC